MSGQHIFNLLELHISFYYILKFYLQTQELALML